MRKLFSRAAPGALVIATLFMSPVLAQSYDEGAKAYNKRDYHTALKNWQPLAEKGDVKAQFNVGLLYAQGLGVDLDFKEAVKYWQKAAAQKNPEASFQLGRVYAEGRKDIDKNPAEAVKWFRASADLGNPQAQAQLGDLYARGEGVAKSEKDALTWYKKAVAQGYTPAMASVGAMYESGKGVPVDKSKAYTYFTLAVAKATGKEAEAATASRNRIAAALKPEQVKAARETASKCMAAEYKNCTL
jgi:TPR repeat protein